MEELSSYELVKEGYSRYGQYTNLQRALPSVFDGLKPVQRRLLIAADKIGIGDSIKTIKLVGETNGNYHPHGDDSVSGALYTMVNHVNSLFNPEGNFGYRGLVEAPPSAPRYTGVWVNDLGRDLYLRFIKAAPGDMNELNKWEPRHLPTPIPYALLNGAYGIGVGVSTRIPAIRKDTLTEFVRAYLKGSTLPVLYPTMDGGNVEIDEENLQLFNKTGRCSLRSVPIVELGTVPSENKQGVIIRDYSRKINPVRILAHFRNEMEEKLINIREETVDGKNCIVIVRTPYTRRVSDEELLERTVKVMSKGFSFSTIVCDEKKVFRISPGDWLKSSIDRWAKFHLNGLESDLVKVLDDIEFERVKHDLARHILGDSTDQQIITELNIDERRLGLYKGRSISQLRSTKKDVDRLVSSKSDIESRIQDYRGDSLSSIRGLLKRL